MNIRFRSFISSAYFSVSLLTCAVFAWVMWGKNFSIFFPWQYDGDAIFSAVQIKSVIESGTFWQNSFLGFPNGYQLYDFPLVESGNFLIIYLESLFTKNFAVVLNIYYFFTFLFTALVSVYTCKRLYLNKAFSLCVSVLFAFSSYHLLRGEAHLFLSAYYAIPIYLLFMLYVFSNDIKLTKIQMIIGILAVIFCASTGVYYAFFSCYFLIIIGIFGSLAQKNWTSLVRSIILVGLIGLSVFLNILPSIFYHMEYGNNMEVAQRLSLESEIYGLKIMALLLPPPFSGFSFLHHVSDTYNINSTVGTNLMPYLGIAGSIGFIFLLFVSLNSRCAKFFDEKIITLSTLNLSALLLATVGGFGALFAYLISPEIRCYDRISIFILYFSLLGLALFLQELLLKYKNSRCRIYSWLIAGFLLIVGLYNQTGHYQKDYESIQAKFYNDQRFFQEIENNYPKGASIFQLPYWGFPETAGVYGLLPYDCFRGYLNSKKLKWSCGAVKGRTIANWQENISQKPIPELLENIILIGFSGLYIDRKGYEDQGKQIETQLVSLLNTKPLVSNNGELIFFDLRSYAKTLLSTMSLEQIKEKKEKINQSLKFEINWEKGFYPQEGSLPKIWRWANQKAVLALINNKNIPLHIKLTFELTTPTSAHVTVDPIKLGKAQTFSVDPGGKKVMLSYTLPVGISKIYFKTDSSRVPAQADPREMYFAVQNFSLSFDK